MNYWHRGCYITSRENEGAEMILFKKYRLDRNRVLDKPYYRSLTLYFLPSAIIVSIAPLRIVSIVILNKSNSSHDEKLNIHLKELVLMQTQQKEKTYDRCQCTPG